MSKPSLQMQISGAGPTLVCLPGWGMHTALMQPLIDALNAQFTVIEIDLPGQGLNANVACDYTLPTLAAMLVAQFPEPVHLLGWSLGGLVATYIAQHYPDKVKALILIASSPLFVARQAWPGMRAENIDRFHQQLDNDPEQTLQQFFQLQCLGCDTPMQTLKSIKKCWATRPTPTTQALRGGLTLLRESDLRCALIECQHPTLMIYGEHDRIVPLATRDAVNKIAAHIDTTTIAKAAHMPFFTHAQTCHQQITGWLQ